MNLEQMKKIVEGAPKGAVSFNTASSCYYSCFGLTAEEVLLSDLRTEIAKHDTLDLEPSDIPHGCVVVEK